MGLKEWASSLIEKFNPAQAIIERAEGTSKTSVPGYVKITSAYDDVEVLRRGIDMLVNGAASFDFTVTEKINGVTPVINGIRKTKLHNLLNFQPNLYQDTNKFRRQLYTDLVLEGNAFIYYDGAYLYVLPAVHMEIFPDKKTFVKKYKYMGDIEFLPEEIIHVADNSSESNYRGTSPLHSTTATLETRKKMLKFQDNFFNNGAVPGLVLKSPNVLGEKIKQRLIESWLREYNPQRGGKRPMVLDGGLDVAKLSDVNFKELDFEQSIDNKDDDLLMALGVPSILLKGGNNANISPNLRLFYLETVLPKVRQVTSAFERFFGYNLEEETAKVSALQPDMKEAAAYFTTLVNGGVITPNEARQELRYESIVGHDDLRIPANIAGSAADPSQGGRPAGDNKPNGNNQ